VLTGLYPESGAFYNTRRPKNETRILTFFHALLRKPRNSARMPLSIKRSDGARLMINADRLLESRFFAVRDASRHFAPAIPLMSANAQREPV
jgi:hypothetical protein